MELENLKRKREFKWLEENLADATRDPSKLHYAGTLINRLAGEKQYGSGMMELLADKLGKSVSQLSGFRKFSGQWSNDEVEKLNLKASEQGIQLTWSHFRALLRVNEKQLGSKAQAEELRQKLIRRCLREGWNYRQLQSAVQKELGVEREERPLARPENIEKGLEDFIQHTQAYLRRVDEVWFGKNGAIAEETCPHWARQHAKLVSRTAERAKNHLVQLVDRAESLVEQFKTVGKKK